MIKEQELPVTNNDNIDYQKYIHIKGAKSNNLKDIEIVLPKEKLIVVTGLSGSGKSSLIMDTLYAEGQRRYVESLSSYARQFLSRMKKPKVDFIKGISPAIAIEQRVSSSNARSTVGTLTEVYDYLRLLFARIGKTISPISGNIVTKHQVSDVVDFILSKKDGTKISIYIPFQAKYDDRNIKTELEMLLQRGYSRVNHNNELQYIEEILESDMDLDVSVVSEEATKYRVLIDRFSVSQEDDNMKRIADSVLTAFAESEGNCIVLDHESEEETKFNNRFELDGIEFLEPSHQLFNFNNPYGACKVCEGYGKILGIDPKKVIPNESLSVYEGAIAAWKGEKNGLWLDQLISAAHLFDFPIHRPYFELTKQQKETLWKGNNYFLGINAFFEELQEKTYKIQNRVMLARYRGKTECTNCGGGRLRKEASYVKIGGRDIMEVVDLPITDLKIFFDGLELSENDAIIAKRILFEVNNRLEIMDNIGLGYLSMNRLSNTLSGGETQRINLTRTIGSNLTNSLYILDEPSIGLHPKDTARLVEVLKQLRDLDNTVIVVEHEEEVITNADYIVDIGPLAGVNGGEVVFAGDYKSFRKGGNGSLTAAYLNGVKKIAVPASKRKVINKLMITGARQHNLKNIDVTIPLNAITVITGVSGSGKTSLVKHIIYPALKKHLDEPVGSMMGDFNELTGDLSQVTAVEMINQNPIGRSSRSNPVTYVKAYDAIRKVYADQQASKIKGLAPKHFSFNVDGGRCDNCKGDGEITVEMQFLADVKLVCEDCKGKRFKQDILEVEYKGKNIADVLDMTIDEAIDFFEDNREILSKIGPLSQVGLGYVQLGQSSSTLSGGEAQRIKLASYLGKDRASERIFFIFDEPTTGLHFHDIEKLMIAMNGLVENGHTVLIVEHNMDVIKCADWAVDLGPVGGNDGGYLIFQGPPEDLAKVEESFTGQFLKEKFE
ncbi:excinuclease ABC subunit UvrA [Portibacter lacus]|uniref:UvrABC system protein A n=1 Tax=Portibacter lacus TaxID=1099794 RepID=A0AA37SQF8_9BACT|nr:excinuclease ABC subunit UvrA [Portibacter lacus]GLR17484.1 UvrABC system protein A [Portibacter lacus]